MSPRTRCAAVVFLALLAAACRGGSTTEPVTRLVVGTLAADLAAAVQAPDSVFAGSAFAVTVVTEGTPCETAAGGEARVQGLEATVTPYVMEYRGVCELSLVRHPRAVLVRFDRPGTATVRVRGAGGRATARSVVVRPAP